MHPHANVAIRLAIVTVLAAPAAARAAEDYKPIDCGDSKIFVSAALKCRTKRVDDQFRRTTGEEFQTYGLDGDVSFSASMRYAGFRTYLLPPTERDIEWQMRGVAGGPSRSTEWSATTMVSGSRVARFKRDGKFPCFAFHTTGPRSPTHKEGYRFLALGYVCKRAGSFAGDDDVAAQLKRVTYRD